MKNISKYILTVIIAVVFLLQGTPAKASKISIPKKVINAGTVELNKYIVVNFSKPVNSATITSKSVTLVDSTSRQIFVGIELTPDGKQLRINKNRNIVFRNGVKYYLILNSAIKYNDGTAMSPYAYLYTAKGLTAKTKDGKSGIFTGVVKSGQPVGKGVFTRLDKGKVVWTYAGNFVNGMQSGYSTIYYADGSLYEGTLSNGNLSGKGKLTYNKGYIYEGDFVNSEMSGYGVLKFDGNEYRGQFARNQFNGMGMLITKTGQIISGNFVDGNYVNQGGM